MKKIYILLISILLFTGCEKSTKAKLKEAGYIDEEITFLTTSLNEEDINVILNMEYNELITKFIKGNNFKIENLDRYINYYEENSSINNIILLVNEDIDKITTYHKLIPDLLKQTYFIKSNLIKYINYYEINNLELKDIITNVNSEIDNDFYTNTKPTDLSKGNLILVNKFNYLDSNYVPCNLIAIDSKYGYEYQMNSEAYNSFINMYNDASKENLKLFIKSPYRSYNNQNNLYNDYVYESGILEADTFSARPGYSEHQTGLAIDVSNGPNNLGYFKDTNEYIWMINNSYKYGFILRYPEGKEYITGYQFESWHYRYVGIEVATKIHDLGITFEEYYAYFIK